MKSFKILEGQTLSSEMIYCSKQIFKAMYVSVSECREQYVVDETRK